MLIKSLLAIEVSIHIESRTNYHNKNFTLRVALKEIEGNLEMVYWSIPRLAVKAKLTQKGSLMSQSQCNQNTRIKTTIPNPTILLEFSASLGLGSTIPHDVLLFIKKENVQLD